MATTDESQACPALHVLFGAMGVSEESHRTLWPECDRDKAGRCRHCQPEVADRRYGYGC